MRSKREKKYYKNNHNYMINYRIKALLRYFIVNNKTNSKKLPEYTGWTIEEFKKDFEKKFLEGMSWGNFGQWHIDHKKPKCFFTYSSSSCISIKECWALENLQPLWSEDNIKKGVTIWN